MRDIEILLMKILKGTNLRYRFATPLTDKNGNVLKGSFEISVKSRELSEMNRVIPYIIETIKKANYKAFVGYSPIIKKEMKVNVVYNL